MALDIGQGVIDEFRSRRIAGTDRTEGNATVMKAFVAGCAAAIVLAVVSAVVLDQLGFGAAEVYSTSNVRL